MGTVEGGQAKRLARGFISQLQEHKRQGQDKDRGFCREAESDLIERQRGT